MTAIVKRYVPLLRWLPEYDRSSFVPDALAAVSVWALLVPQGLAYAGIAGVPVQYGLYAAFAALVAYAVFGTSRHLVAGPSASVAAVSAAVVTGIVGTAAFGTPDAVPWTAGLALIAGAVYVALGLARMGWVSNFLSRAVMAGFVLGFSIGIIIDQSHKLLGVSKADGTYVEILIDTIEEIPDTSGATLAVGALSLGALLLLRAFFGKLPRALIVMVLSIAAVSVFDLQDHGVAVTGSVPTGLFSVGVPDIGWWGELPALIGGAFSVVFVGYSETLAAGRAMARKHGYEIDPDQELIAQGAACGASGFVGGFAVDGSLSKTSVADAAGQRTQMASLINAGLVLLTILFLANVFEDLPSAVLGAVVIDAMVGLLDFGELRRYYRVNRADWVFYTAAALGILLFGIIQGIVIGVVLSLLLLIWRSSRPRIRTLGRDGATNDYLDLDGEKHVEAVPGVVVVRLDGPLFFADANLFRDELKKRVAEAEGPVELVVLDADAISQTDTDGADVLMELATELQQNGTRLVLARVKPEILDLWRRAGTLAALGPNNTFDTVHAAVESPQKRT
jgi:SulP family sulfate permease